MFRRVEQDSAPSADLKVSATSIGRTEARLYASLFRIVGWTWAGIRQEPVNALEDITLMGRKLFPHTLAVKECPALVRRKVAKMTEGHHHCLPAGRRQSAPLGKNVPRFLPLSRREPRKNLLALPDGFFFLRRLGVPFPQALANQLLAFW